MAEAEINQKRGRKSGRFISGCGYYITYNTIAWATEIEGMHKVKLTNGIFEAEVTLYKSGNIHIGLTNLVTKETKNMQTRKKGNGKGYIE